MNKTVAQLCDELTQLCHQGYAQVPVTLSIGKNNYGIGIKLVNKTAHIHPVPCKEKIRNDF